MYAGQTLKAIDGYEVCLYPLESFRCTQTYAGDFSHQCVGQTNTGLYDVTGVDGDSHKGYIYAPFTCEILYIGQGERNGHQCVCRSLDKVHLADGSLQYAMFSFGHDNTMDVSVGKTYSQGTHIGNCGDYGYGVTGVHSHFLLYVGYWDRKAPPVCTTPSGGTNFYSPNPPSNIDKFFYGNNTNIVTTSKDGINFNFKNYTGSTTTTYTLTLKVSGNGYTIGGGTYDKGEKVTFKAVANTGATFEKWSDGYTSTTRTITMNNNVTLTAYFTGETPEPEPTTWTVTLYVTPDGAGYCTGAGTYEDGQEATLEAFANKGYEFVSWNDGYNNPLRYWTITNNLTLTAIFKKKDNLKGTLQDTFIIKALKVIHGDYGTGKTRKAKLGSDYYQVQKIVNYLIAYYTLYDRVAMMCWIGLYGNGITRKRKLTSLGYNYTKVQTYVKKYNKTKIVVKY